MVAGYIISAPSSVQFLKSLLHTRRSIMEIINEETRYIIRVSDSEFSFKKTPQGQQMALGILSSFREIFIGKGKDEAVANIDGAIAYIEMELANVSTLVN